MCVFIAQLVEHRTGIAEVTGSNPVEALIFFRLLLSNCLKWKIYCHDHSSLSLIHNCHYFAGALCMMNIIGFDQGCSYLNGSHTRRQNKPAVIAVNHHHHAHCSCGKTPGILIHKSFLLRMEFQRINRAKISLRDRTSHARF